METHSDSSQDWDQGTSQHQYNTVGQYIFIYFILFYFLIGRTQYI